MPYPDSQAFCHTHQAHSVRLFRHKALLLARANCHSNVLPSPFVCTFSVFCSPSYLFKKQLTHILQLPDTLIQNKVWDTKSVDVGQDNLADTLPCIFICTLICLLSPPPQSLSQKYSPRSPASCHTCPEQSVWHCSDTEPCCEPGKYGVLMHYHVYSCVHCTAFCLLFHPSPPPLAPFVLKKNHSHRFSSSLSHSSRTKRRTLLRHAALAVDQGNSADALPSIFICTLHCVLSPIPPLPTCTPPPFLKKTLTQILQHLVTLVQNKVSDTAQTQNLAASQGQQTSWRAHHNVWTRPLQGVLVSLDGEAPEEHRNLEIGGVLAEALIVLADLIGKFTCVSHHQYRDLWGKCEVFELHRQLSFSLLVRLSLLICHDRVNQGYHQNKKKQKKTPQENKQTTKKNPKQFQMSQLL